MAQTGKEGLTSYQELLTRKEAVGKGLAKIDFIAEQILAGTFMSGRNEQFSREHLRALPFDQRIEAGVRMGEINRRLQESAKPTLQAAEGTLASLQDRVQGIIDLVAHGHLPQSFLDDIFADNEKEQSVVIKEPVAQPAIQNERLDRIQQSLDRAHALQIDNTRQRILALDRIVTTVTNPQSEQAIDRAELTTIGIATAKMRNIVGALQGQSEKEAWVLRQITLPKQGFLGALLERFRSGATLEEDQTLLSHIQQVMRQNGVETNDPKVATDYFKTIILPAWDAIQNKNVASRDVEVIVETPVQPGRRDVLVGKLEQYGNQRAEVLLHILRQESVTREELVDVIYATSPQQLRYKEAVDEPLLRWEVARGVIEAGRADGLLSAMATRYNEGKAPVAQQQFMSELIQYVQARVGGEITPHHAVSYFKREVFAPWADKISSEHAVETVDEMLLEMKRVTEEYEQIYGEKLIIE